MQFDKCGFLFILATESLYVLLKISNAKERNGYLFVIDNHQYLTIIISWFINIPKYILNSNHSNQFE